MTLQFEDKIQARADIYSTSDRVAQRAAAGLARAQADLRNFANARIAEIQADKTLSAQGHKLKKREAIADMLQETARSKAKIQKMRDAAEKSKPQLSVEHARDAYSAAVDIALAAHLRSMDENARESALARDPDIGAAVLRLPRALTGATDMQVKAVRERALEAEHPGAMEKIRGDLEALDFAEHVADTTLETLRSHGEFFDGQEWRRFSAEALKPIADELKVVA